MHARAVRKGPSHVIRTIKAFAAGFLSTRPWYFRGRPALVEGDGDPEGAMEHILGTVE